ncbi:hypothetical protein P8625_03455 [Tenacibaculum tangerinum]|uniref:Uncharacterized protein n=1 Tax=Tenacibaculum tangerinum TaxID=3038772 RepID=A0ABY8L8C0_9FLAO|nr:hypothetical protein [Tenacibaculum tangerinum]WGH76235.1 hypothetical protein P8625_03455 [Tenacibaculum tangerinum]
MKLKFRKALMLLTICFTLYFSYSNYRINGTWVKSSEKRTEGVSIIDFSFFERSEYYPSSFGNNIIDQTTISFGKIIFLFNTDTLNYRNTISIKQIDGDSIVFDNFPYYETSTYKKIPDYLKQKRIVKLYDKLYKLKYRYKDSTYIDTVFFSRKYFLNKAKLKANDWRVSKYETFNINDFKIILFDLNSYAILREENNELFFYQLGRKKRELRKVNLQKIPLNNLKSEINKAIKDYEKQSPNKHPHQ